MYLHADQLPENTVLQGFDLCIVGAGAAGIAMAHRLANSSLKLLLLVSGTPGDKTLPDAERQSLYHGTVGDFLNKVDPVFLHRSRLNMYGGTTNHFGFWARPLDPIDFLPRPGFRDVAWPFTAGELKPYYVDAHHFGQFGPLNYDDMHFWEDVLYGRCFDPLPGDTMAGAIMHAQYEENLHDFQIQFRDELKNAENVTVLFNAHLLDIATDDEQRHVRELNCSIIADGRRGQGFKVRATAYTLACGGIENVRLLQLSGDLGNNKRDQLGRGFMVHPLLTNAAIVQFDREIPTEIRNFFREQQIRLQPPEVAGDSYRHMVAPLVNPELVFEYLTFNAWGVLVPKPHIVQEERIGNFRIILYFGADRASTVVNLNWEQTPDEGSRIFLDREQVDPVFGQPVAHVDWRLNERDKRSASRALAITIEYLRQHGGARHEMITDVSGGPDEWTLLPDEGALETGDHHLGALRMSSSPEDGVVDSNSRLHNVDNLYIAGSAVFPTGGYANPTLTIVALALRLADHLETISR